MKIKTQPLSPLGDSLRLADQSDFGDRSGLTFPVISGRILTIFRFETPGHIYPRPDRAY